LPELRTLSLQLEVISDVGHRPDAGHKLMSEAAAAELERAWREDVRSASVDELVAEGELVRVLLLAKREAESTEPELTIPKALAHPQTDA